MYGFPCARRGFVFPIISPLQAISIRLSVGYIRFVISRGKDLSISLWVRNSNKNLEYPGTEGSPAGILLYVVVAVKLNIDQAGVPERGDAYQPIFSQLNILS